MSIQISHFILHQIKKMGSKFDLNLRESELQIDENAKRMISEINRVYNQKSKVFATFEENSDFAQLTQNFVAEKTNFIEFSSDSASCLFAEMEKYEFVSGGILVFCHYFHLATEYLLITLLPQNESLLINDSLQVSSVLHLDLDRLDFAARISLSDFQASVKSDYYLTFLKGRVGRKIADFFLDFLQAKPNESPKKQNEMLIDAIDLFVDSSDLEKNEKMAYKKNVFDYCKQQIQLDENLELTEISSILSNENEQSFERFLSENAFDLDEKFPADKKTIRQLTKYFGSGGGLTISFDSNLLGEKIIWDHKNQQIIIKHIPPNLRFQLENNEE